MTISSVQVPRARLIVAATAAATAAAILWFTRGFIFYYDEWSFILSAQDWDWTSYLQPHNEHPSILFKLIYAALLNTVGLRSYLPYIAVVLAFHALDVVLLFEVVRRRAGDLVGIACATALLVLGAGAENILWAFQLAWLASIACGLSTLLVLQGPPTHASAATAVTLVAASLMFSGIGLIFAIAAVVELVASPQRRRDLLWFVPLGMAFVVWYVAFGHFNATPTVPPPSAANLFRLPAYAGWGLAGSAAGIVGVTGTPALALLILAAGAIAFAWWRHRPDPTAIGVAAALIAFYVVTGMARAQLGYWQSAAERYTYVGSVLWLVLLADAARLLAWRGPWRPLLVACVLLACVNSTSLLVANGSARARVMQRVTADMQALAVERTDSCLNPSGAVDPHSMPPVTSPAVYYRATARYGDPTAGLAITDRADFDNARRHLLRSDCSPTYT